MRLIFYPDRTLFDNYDEDSITRDKGRVAKELYKLKKNDVELYLKVRNFIRKITESDDLEIYQKIGHIKSLGNSLMEMRIPPTRNKGVFRIYFYRDGDTLVLLDAETKHDKAANNINNAKRLVKEYIRSSKNGYFE